MRVHRVGICGTDVSGYLGKMPFFTYPVLPGHELGVEVVEVGEGVTNVKPGDRCSVEPYMNCQECFACRNGNTNCCESLEVIGVHKDGGMCEQFVLPARKLHPSEKLTLDQLALWRPRDRLPVDRAATREGEKVLVIGAGPIGLAVIEFLKVAKAEITVMDMNETRLAFCKDRLGVDHTVVFKGDDTEVERLKEVNGGKLPTTVIDATGSHVSIPAFQYAAFRGRWLRGITRGVNIQACNHSSAGVDGEGVTAVQAHHQADWDGVIDTTPLSHSAGYDEFVGEFHNWLKPEAGVSKAILHMT